MNAAASSRKHRVIMDAIDGDAGLGSTRSAAPGGILKALPTIEQMHAYLFTWRPIRGAGRRVAARPATRPSFAPAAAAVSIEHIGEGERQALTAAA